MIELNLEQGSEAWLHARRKAIGASEASAIMGESEWATPYSTWIEKTGRKEKLERVGPTKPVPFQIERGNRLEPAARARYELLNNIDMPAKVFIHPDYPYLLASLDGFNEQERLVLELKVPGREVFDEAKAGRVHRKYIWQLEHQIYVTGAKKAHFYCVKIGNVNGRETIIDGALVEYYSNPELLNQLIPKLHEFWNEYILKDTPPPLTQKDILILESDSAKEKFSELADVVKTFEIQEAALEQAEFLFEAAKRDYELANSRLQSLKEDIAPFFSHPRIRSGGLIAVKKTYKNGRELIELKLVG